MHTISPKGGTRESATQNKVQKAIKSLFTAKRVNNPERKMFKETQTIQREPKYRKYTRSSSEQERKVNALASGADEGRDKLR